MTNIPLTELLKLSVPERIQLAENLWDSIAAEPDALPLTDPTSAIPWEEVRVRLRQRFG
jgi:hypothetical protein